MTDWDDAYQNGKYIVGAESYAGMWHEKSTAFRAALSPERQALAQPYGPHPREVFDLFLPEGVPKGVLIFIHGGYWLSFNQSLWSHLAAGPLSHGWAVAMPGYRLCPEVSIADITQEIAQAVAEIGARVAGDIIISGHSAGGHLTARMACENVTLPVSGRIRRYVSISGVHDLRPLTRTGMNQALQLDLKSAAAESPALRTPRADVDLLAWVGAEERPEFLRQNDLLANIWRGAFATTRAVHARGHHHFSVIEDFEQAHSPLLQAIFP